MGKIIVIEDNPIWDVCVYPVEETWIQHTKRKHPVPSAKLVAGCGEDDIILADLRLLTEREHRAAPLMRMREWTALHCHDRLRGSAYGSRA